MWSRLPLHVQIVIGIAVGVALGLVFGPAVSVLKPIGDIFIRLLTMLIVPLTFFTLLAGFLKLESVRSFRSLGGATLVYYGISSFAAAAIGLACGLLLAPGRHAAGLLGAAPAPEAAAGTAAPSLVDNIVSWVPQNPVDAFAQGNMLQVIVFTLLLGFGLIVLGPRAAPVVRVVDAGAELAITVTGLVMKTAPFGILALVADMVATLDARMLAEVARFILTDYLAMLIILGPVYIFVLRGLARLGPLRFYRHAAPAILVAGSTTSSGAALPAAMTSADRSMGVSEKVWGFTLPLGASINQNGSAGVYGVIAVFAAYLHGAPLTPAFLLEALLLSFVLSTGTAGIKGAGIVVSGILLRTLDLPLTLVPILASIWPLIDVGHTITNVTGDLVGTVLVARRMGEIDTAVYGGVPATPSAGPISPRKAQGE